MENQLFSDEIPGFGSIYDHILNTLDTTVADIYWKDKKGRYLGVNKTFLNFASLQSYDDVIGKTDWDLCWAEQAPIMRENDSEVIYMGIAKKCIEPSKIGNKIKLFLNHKRPLRSRTGKIIGVFGMSIMLDGDRTAFSNFTAQGLSKRQTECLYYLTRGKTAKEIANILNLSCRTVEHYLDTIKTKWNCNSRQELLEIALFRYESFDTLFQIV